MTDSHDGHKKQQVRIVAMLVHTLDDKILQHGSISYFDQRMILV